MSIGSTLPKSYEASYLNAQNGIFTTPELEKAYERDRKLMEGRHKKILKKASTWNDHKISKTVEKMYGKVNRITIRLKKNNDILSHFIETLPLNSKKKVKIIFNDGTHFKSSKDELIKLLHYSTHKSALEFEYFLKRALEFARIKSSRDLQNSLSKATEARKVITVALTQLIQNKAYFELMCKELKKSLDNRKTKNIYSPEIMLQANATVKSLEKVHNARKIIERYVKIAKVELDKAKDINEQTRSSTSSFKTLPAAFVQDMRSQTDQKES